MATLEDEIADRIREYSDMFGTAFHAKDVTLIRPYCHIPAMRLMRTGVGLVPDFAELDAGWQRAHDMLRPLNYHHSVLHTVDVTVCNPAAAFVSVDCGRFNTEGEEFQRFKAHYTVALTDENWKITAWLGG